MSQSEILFAMTADTQDTAFGEMRSFVKAVRAAGLATLRHAGSEGDGSVEIFCWAHDARPEHLQAEIRDDENLPAMYLILRGEAQTVAAASELAPLHFELVPLDEVVRLARTQHADDPSLLLMAALVTGRQHHEEVVGVLSQASRHRDKAVRKAAVQAAGILAGDAGRRLVEEALASESDPTLRRGMQRVLESLAPPSR